MNKSGNSESMSRHAFLKSLGLKGAALAAVYFSSTGLHSCTNATVDPSGSSFTIDLADTAYAALQTNGGYIVKNGIVLTRTNTGSLVAVTLTCSHEGRKQITYQTDHFYCTAHGAKFDNAGKGLNSEGRNGLTVYTVTQTDTTVTVTV